MCNRILLSLFMAIMFQSCSAQSKARLIDRDMPIWVFHGNQDESIPVSESEEMVKKLREMGYGVRFTKYKGVGHDSWVKAYDTETLYDWFVAQAGKD